LADAGAQLAEALRCDAEDAEYRGPAADARAERIRAALGTDEETLQDTVWLLRYIGVKNSIPFPTVAELFEIRSASVAPPLPSPRAVTVPSTICGACNGLGTHAHGFGQCAVCGGSGIVRLEPAP
jgi:hypothetical protein